MTIKPPFDMMRAAFLLIAFIVIVEISGTVLAAGACAWLVISGANALGACSGVVAQIREVWAEVLAAILALLLASRSNGKPPT